MSGRWSAASTATADTIFATGDTATVVASCMADVQRAISLEIPNALIRGEGAPRIAQALEANTSLTRLSFSAGIDGMQGWQEGGTVVLDAAMTEADLSGNKLGFAGAVIVSAFLPKCKALSSLSIANNDIGPNGAQRVAKAVVAMRTITALDISSNELEDEGAEHLAEALGANVLSTLNLSDNNLAMFGDMTGIAALARAVKANEALTSLNLSGSGLCPRSLQGGKVKTEIVGIVALSVALKANATLLSLDLSNNAMGSAGAQYIARSMETNAALRCLNLSDSLLGRAGALHLAKVLEVNGTLQDLRLASNRLVSGDKGTGEYDSDGEEVMEVDASGLLAIRAALEANEALSALDLRLNAIPEPQLQALRDTCAGTRVQVSVEPQQEPEHSEST